MQQSSPELITVRHVLQCSSPTHNGCLSVCHLTIRNISWEWSVRQNLVLAVYPKAVVCLWMNELFRLGVVAIFFQVCVAWNWNLSLPTWQPFACPQCSGLVNVKHFLSRSGCWCAAYFFTLIKCMLRLNSPDCVVSIRDEIIFECQSLTAASSLSLLPFSKTICISFCVGAYEHVVTWLCLNHGVWNKVECKLTVSLSMQAWLWLWKCECG